MADIDMIGVDWVPIRTFVGKFDGNGYVIRNLTINQPDIENVGLFGHNNGLIRNVELLDATVIGRNITGSLVGFNSGIVENSKVTGNSRVEGTVNVGGLVGYVEWGGIVRKSYSTADVQGTRCVGGLVGIHITGIIEQCYAIGNVSAVSDSGGLIGQLYISNAIVRNSFATGNVSGTNSGGLSGSTWFSGTRIENSYSLSNNPNGLNSGSPVIVNSYFDKDLSVSSKVQGRTTEAMHNQTTYVDWDFDTIWVIEDGYYPYLKGLPNPYKVIIGEDDEEEEEEEELLLSDCEAKEVDDTADTEADTDVEMDTDDEDDAEEMGTETDDDAATEDTNVEVDSNSDEGTPGKEPEWETGPDVDIFNEADDYIDAA
jgi:hypothetical protein